MLIRCTLIYGVWVPAGFITDGSSVPKLARPAITPFGKGLGAALVHDYRCTVGVNTRDYRVKCDGEYAKNLRSEGISPVTAYAAYRALRLFSKSHYRNGSYEDLMAEIRTRELAALELAVKAGDHAAAFTLDLGFRPLGWEGYDTAAQTYLAEAAA